MGLFDFLQNIGSLGQMVRNVVETYKKFKVESAESDLERFIAMAVLRYLHPSVPNREINRAKVVGNMLGLIENGEPVGLYGFCSGIAWAEMDVERDDLDTQKNIIKILLSSGVSYDEAYGKIYDAEDLHRIAKKFNL